MSYQASAANRRQKHKSLYGSVDTIFIESIMQPCYLKNSANNHLVSCNTVLPP